MWYDPELSKTKFIVLLNFKQMMASLNNKNVAERKLTILMFVILTDSEKLHIIFSFHFYFFTFVEDAYEVAFCPFVCVFVVGECNFRPESLTSLSASTFFDEVKCCSGLKSVWPHCLQAPFALYFANIYYDFYVV